MPRNGHAVVLGAGIAGLLAAGALTETHDRVTIIERDQFRDAADPVCGLPQGIHAHALMPRGARAFDQLLPGVIDELTRAGAVPVEPLVDHRMIMGGRRLLSTPVGATAMQASSQFVKWRVRERVQKLTGVEMLDGCDVVGLLTDQTSTRVIGVRVLRRDPGSAVESVSAVLVVDATGRGSRTPVWLEGLSYDRPVEDRAKADLGCASRYLRLASDADVEAAVMVGPVPGHARGMALHAVEGGLRLLTLVGLGRENHPPADDDGFLAFAASVAPPDVAAAIRAAEPTTGIAMHRYPAYQRRHYRRLRRFPDGLLVIGDALCTFSPIQAAGMAVAAVEALELRRCLAGGPDRLALRYFAAADRTVNRAWQVSLGSDLALAEVDGRRTPGIRLTNAYLARLLALAERDPIVAGQVGRVIGLLDAPAALTRPAILRRVLTARHLRAPAHGATARLPPPT